MVVTCTLRHRFVIGPDGTHPLPATVYCPRYRASRDVSQCLDCPRLADLGGESLECDTDDGAALRVAGALVGEAAMCVAPELPVVRVYGELLRSVDLLPVVESDATLVGVIGRREIEGLTRLDGHLTVTNVMRSARWLSVREDEPLERVARMMTRHRARHLPVVDARGHLVSIVDDTCLLRAFSG